MLCLLPLAAAPFKPPNIVFILADDLGIGDLGCYGQRTLRTPNIDRLAESGITFTQHYAGAPVCSPSRACLLTGQDTGHGWVRGNGNIALRPDPSDLTIASLLKRAGYTTAMIGKSCVQCEVPDLALPNAKGFDYFFGETPTSACHNHYPSSLSRNGAPVYNTGAAFDHDLFLNEVRGYLATRGADRKPFFLLYSMTLPHASLQVPDRWKSPYENKFPESPFAGQLYSPVTDPKATYAGMVARLDYDVGEIVQNLRADNLDGDTVVFFTSDNGGMSEGGHRVQDFRSNGIFRGRKRDLYEGGLRIPMIASWRGRIPAGARTNHVSAFWDFLPTACDLVGIHPPDRIQGISFAPTLLQKGIQTPHDSLYWEFHELGGRRAMRRGRWKAIQYNVDRSPGGPIELYDLKTDPGEQHDLAASNSELVMDFRRSFELARTEHPLYPFGRVRAGG